MWNYKPPWWAVAWFILMISMSVSFVYMVLHFVIKYW